MLRLETLAEDATLEDAEDATVELVVLEDVEEVDFEEVTEAVLDGAEDAGAEDVVLEGVEDAGADAAAEADVLHPALAEVYPAFDDGAVVDEQDAPEMVPYVTLAMF